MNPLTILQLKTWRLWQDLYLKWIIVCDGFLALIPVADATAANIYSVMTTFFEENTIPFKDKLIGFSSDGANNIME